MTTGITIQRGGRTANTWTPVQHKPSIKAYDGKVKLRLSLDSKGGGITDVLATISPEAFEHIAQQMLKANPQAALRAFGQALTDYTAPTSN